MYFSRQKGRLLIFVAILFVSTIFAGCQKAEKSGQGITIGLVTPLSGEVADLGKEMLSSAELAIGRAKKENPGLNLKLVARDDQMSAEAAATAVKALVAQEGTIAIVGAGMSSVVKGEIEALKDKNIPLLTSTATETQLVSGATFVFRVIPPNSAQSEALASFANKLGAKTAAIVFQQDDYSKDLKNTFKEAFEAKGGKVILEVGFEKDENDFRVQLGKVKSTKADVLICPAQHVQVARILVRAKELNIKIPILSGETAYTDKVLAASGGAAKEFYVTGSAFDMEKPSQSMKTFLDEYQAANNKNPGAYGCYTYDAVSLIASVIAKEKPKDGADLINKIRSVKGYTGISGDITFDAKGDVRKIYKIYKVENGVFKGVN